MSKSRFTRARNIIVQMWYEKDGSVLYLVTYGGSFSTTCLHFDSVESLAAYLKELEND